MGIIGRLEWMQTEFTVHRVRQLSWQCVFFLLLSIDKGTHPMIRWFIFKTCMPHQRWIILPRSSVFVKDKNRNQTRCPITCVPLLSKSGTFIFVNRNMGWKEQMALNKGSIHILTFSCGHVTPCAASYLHIQTLFSYLFFNFLMIMLWI